MSEEARAASSLAPERVVVKLPATLEAVRVAAALVPDGIRCALTAVYSPAQALLAHEVGCVWVIPYVDRAARQSVGGLVIVDSLAAILASLHSTTRILAASLKSGPQVVEAILHGSHDVTAPLDVLKALPAHPLTESAVQGVPRRDGVLGANAAAATTQAPTAESWPPTARYSWLLAWRDRTSAGPRTL